MPEAQQIFDQFLSDPKNLAPAEQRDLADLLVQMDRPAEAIRLLRPLYQADPTEEAGVANLVLAEVRLNNRLGALALIDRAAETPIKDAGLWLELATRLYREHADTEALTVSQRVARERPAMRSALLLAARTHLRLFEVDSARQILNDYHGDLNDREYSTAMADYHTVVGEYAEAIAIAKHRLREDASDIEAAILLGNAYRASRQFFLAEAAYVAALEICTAVDETQQREIRRLLAKNRSQRRSFSEAICELEEMLATQPSDVATRLMLMEVLVDSKNYAAAENLSRSMPADAGPRDRFAMRVELAYLLLKQCRTMEALEEFKLLATDPNGHLPDVAYGLYRSASLLGQPDLARMALGLGPTRLAPVAAWGVAFANRATSFCDRDSAAAVLDDATKCAPGNPLLLNLRGEVALSSDCDCRRDGCPTCGPKLLRAFGQPHVASGPDADGWFQSSLQLSPTNVRSRLGLARTLARHLEFEHSVAEYQVLLKYLPCDVNLIRETARTIESWQGIEAAGPLYGRAACLQTTDPIGTPTAKAPVGLGGRLVGGLGNEAAPPPVPGELLSTEYRANTCARGELNRRCRCTRR